MRIIGLGLRSTKMYPSKNSGEGITQICRIFASAFETHNRLHQVIKNNIERVKEDVQLILPMGMPDQGRYHRGLFDIGGTIAE